MEEKEIHVLKQYSHIYLPYTPSWIISERGEFEKTQRERLSGENTISQGEKNQFLSPSEHLKVSN